MLSDFGDNYIFFLLKYDVSTYLLLQHHELVELNVTIVDFLAKN